MYRYIHMHTRVHKQTNYLVTPPSTRRAQHLKEGLQEAFQPPIHTPQKSHPRTSQQQLSCVPQPPTNAGAATYASRWKATSAFNPQHHTLWPISYIFCKRQPAHYLHPKMVDSEHVPFHSTIMLILRKSVQ